MDSALENYSDSDWGVSDEWGRFCQLSLVPPQIQPDSDQPDAVLTVMGEPEITVSTQEGVSDAVLTVVDEPEITVSTSSKRRKGQGTGRIQWRTVTKKSGKQYQQAWYDWQVPEGGKTKTRTKYIPKRLLPKILEMEAAKSPVAAILDLLGVG